MSRWTGEEERKCCTVCRAASVVTCKQVSARAQAWKTMLIFHNCSNSVTVLVPGSNSVAVAKGLVTALRHSLRIHCYYLIIMSFICYIWFSITTCHNLIHIPKTIEMGGIVWQNKIRKPTIHKWNSVIHTTEETGWELAPPVVAQWTAA